MPDARNDWRRTPRPYGGDPDSPRGGSGSRRAKIRPRPSIQSIVARGRWGNTPLSRRGASNFNPEDEALRHYQSGGLPHLGVPEGYYIPDQPEALPHGYGGWAGAQEAHSPRFPRYTEEHASEPMYWTEERVWRLQRDLVDAGALNGAFVKGRFDGATQEAYVSALSLANQQGTSLSRALTTMSRQKDEMQSLGLGPDGTAGSGSLEPDPVFVEPDFLEPNPEELANMAQSYIEDYLGRPATDNEIALLVDRFEENYRAQWEGEVDIARAEFDRQVEYDDMMEPGGGDPAWDNMTEAEQLVARAEGRAPQPASAGGGGELRGRILPRPVDAAQANVSDVKDVLAKAFASTRDKREQRASAEQGASGQNVFDALIGGRF